MSEAEERIVKVAVIGSGLAGLTSAYMLTKSETGSQDNVRFQVHLFEKNATLGMDAASISVGYNDKFRIDVPMRSFMSGYYSHLFRLYRHLAIDIKTARFSFGWYRIEASEATPPTPPATTYRSYMTYSGSRTVGQLNFHKQSTASLGESIKEMFGLCWMGLIVGASYAWLMILSLWYYYRGHLSNPSHPISNMTLQQWFQQHSIHPYFVHSIFVPLFSAVCTNSWESMLNYPAADILEYMAMGLFQESYIAGSGVRQVVDRLSTPLQHIHLNTHIQSIRSGSTHRLSLQDNHGEIHGFDHVIFATQGNQALVLLKEWQQHLAQQTPGVYEEWQDVKDTSSVLEAQIHMLRQFSYENSIVINHTDTSLLPESREHWKALNLATVDASVQPIKSRYTVSFPHSTTMTTHILNMTHDVEKDKEEDILYLQTTNPCIAPSPKHILSASWFERATVTLSSKQAVQKYLFEFTGHDDSKTRLGPCQGKNGLWFVGSYCWKGIPLLEGCVASAERVVSQGIAVTEQVSLEVPCGDRQPAYHTCVEQCSASETAPLPLHLQCLAWTHHQDCQYQCMHTLTQLAIEKGEPVHQYHGKWPFHRLWGIQEPAAVLFSLLNGWYHAYYYRILKQQLKDSYDLKKYYVIMSVFAMNAWVWSTVFHTRDFGMTEKLDYFSAGLYILYSFYLAMIRIFYLRGTARRLLTCVCVLLFTAHVAYLSLGARFDYGYNMTACVIIGVLQTKLWLGWSTLQYTRWGKTERRPYAWMAGLSVTLLACAMSLEVFDFPPFHGVLDAHALWHAVTIPMIPLFYQFLLIDCKVETATEATPANKKRLL
ncbi:Per1-like-domain-containing protein [Spinellus fusiger]|nr:Per1-like-domain-containing protein [Spinellus fusiger]